MNDIILILLCIVLTDLYKAKSNVLWLDLAREHAVHYHIPLYFMGTDKELDLVGVEKSDIRDPTYENVEKIVLKHST